MPRLIALIGLVFLFVFSFSLTPDVKAAPDARQELPAGLKAVKSEDVCMVNDTFMGRPQLAVPVGEKTYYGCCQGCVAKLKKNRSLRFAKDPVTGNEVDKSKAFIAALPNWTVVYFESEETAKGYKAPEGK